MKLTRNLVATGLVVSALTGMVVGLITLVVGERFDQFQINVLLTCAATMGYALIALCCIPLLSRHPGLAIAGLSLVGFAWLFATGTTWHPAPDWPFVRARLSLLIMAIAIAHAALMLLISPRTSLIVILRGAAIACNVLVAAILVLTTATLWTSDFLLAVVIVAAIAGGIASLLAPLINRAIPPTP